MNTRQEEYFLEIVKQKKISKAAEILFLSQSTLSQFLLNLEKELGCALFHRGNKSLELTQEGEIYLQGIEKILEVKKETLENISDLRRNGTVQWRIGISSREGMHLFLTAASQFQQIHPEVSFDIVEGNVKPIMKMLDERTLQMAVLVLSQEDPKWDLLKKEEILLAVPKVFSKDKMVNGLPKGWDKKMILAKRGTAYRQLEDDILDKLSLNPKVVCEINNIEAVRELVAGNMGSSFIPKSLAREGDGILYGSLHPKIYRYHVVCIGKKHKRTPILDEWICTLQRIAAEEKIDKEEFSWHPDPRDQDVF